MTKNTLRWKPSFKTYKKPKDYEKDVKKMTKSGWQVFNVVAQNHRRPLLTPMIFANKDDLVVTYMRERK